MTAPAPTELLEKIISENPYTNYSYVAGNSAIEISRAKKYARMIATEALRQAASVERAEVAAEAAVVAVMTEAYSMLGLELTLPQARRIAGAALASPPRSEGVQSFEVQSEDAGPLPPVAEVARIMWEGDHDGSWSDPHDGQDESKVIYSENASAALDFIREWQARPAAQAVQVPQGFAILPIEPTSMMALRGYQAGHVFDEDDMFSDYIDATDFPADLAPKHKFDDDERGWMLAAAAYRGCVAGYLETLRRLEKDPSDQVAISWNNPIRNTPSVPSAHRGGGE